MSIAKNVSRGVFIFYRARKYFYPPCRDRNIKTASEQKPFLQSFNFHHAGAHRVTLAHEPSHKRLKFDLSLSFCVHRNENKFAAAAAVRTLYYSTGASSTPTHLCNWRNSVSVSIQFSFYYVPASAALSLLRRTHISASRDTSRCLRPF